MPILSNILGVFMPHQESRRSVTNTPLSAVNNEIVHNLDGDNSVLIYINGTGTANCTYSVQVSPDGISYFDAVCFPISQGCVGGTIPLASQPLVSEAINAATVVRTLSVPTGQMQKIRVRLTAYTSGNIFVNINSDTAECISPYARNQKAASLTFSSTTTVGNALTGTLAAVTNLRHYIDRISVVRSATAALTPSATPIVTTTTNLPGSPALTWGQDAAGVGIDREQIMDFGGAGLAATGLGVATTIVCPAYVGVIWRINVSYRLGL